MRRSGSSHRARNGLVLQPVSHGQRCVRMFTHHVRSDKKNGVSVGKRNVDSIAHPVKPLASN